MKMGLFSAILASRVPLASLSTKTGPAKAAPVQGSEGAQAGIIHFAAAPQAPQVGPQAGPFPKNYNNRTLRLIAPPSVHDTALNTVNVMYLVPPLPFQMAPNSNPPPPQAYSVGPKPIVAQGLAQGALNVQAQLGSLLIQAQQLKANDSNFFGGS